MRRGPRRDAPELDQLEGRNVVREALAASSRVKRLLIDDRAVPDVKLKEIEKLAKERGLLVEKTSRDALDHMAQGRIHNGVIALASPLRSPALKDVLAEHYRRGSHPLVLVLDEVQYDQNLGAVLRSADAAGAAAVVIPTRRGAGLSPVVQRIAMGAAEYIPVVREGVMSALADLRRNGFRIVGVAETGSIPWYQADLTGPVVLVLGGEDKGITDTVRSRCQVVCRVPMAGHVPSLNVSATAAIVLFERIRQEASRRGSKTSPGAPAPNKPPPPLPPRVVREDDLEEEPQIDDPSISPEEVDLGGEG